MDSCDIMLRSPTITTCGKLKRSRTRCTAGRKARLSAGWPSTTETMTGQPRTSVRSPSSTCSVTLRPSWL